MPVQEQAAIAFAGQCDRGYVHKENQDAVRRFTVPLGEVMIVADGVSGYEGGGVASQKAVDVFSSSLASMPTFFPPVIAIQEASCRANAEIVAAANEPDSLYPHMSSTVVLALLQTDLDRAQPAVQAYIGHIGDSRAYLVHDRRISRITRDHSATQALLDYKLIDPSKVRDRPSASALMRCLGGEPNVEIEIDEVSLEAGDSLLLCSDGLWGYVPETELERILADTAFDAEAASRALLDLALAAGGHDNVGIQLARLGASTAPPSNSPIPQSIPSATAPSAFSPAAESITMVDLPELVLESEPIPQSSPVPESEPTTEPEIQFVPQFASASPQSSLTKLLAILILAFAASGVLAYFALLNNWFGIANLLH